MEYVRAAKPRVVALFLVTAGAAMAMAGDAGAGLALGVLAALALAVGGAALLNNWLERDIDARMERTRRRPTATGALAPSRAVAAGVIAVVAGVAGLAVTGGPVAALLGAAGVLYYVLVYTLLLKPRTALSAVPGGLAGVFPPLIGWAATGAPWTAEPVVLAAVVFAWSPPHFWALAYALRDDYAAAGIPTPVLRYGAYHARLQILACVATLTALTVAPAAWGLYGQVYLAVALVAGAVIWALVVRLQLRPAPRSAWLVYKASGPYLGAVILAMVLDGL